MLGAFFHKQCYRIRSLFQYLPHTTYFSAFNGTFFPTDMTTCMPKLTSLNISTLNTTIAPTGLGGTHMLPHAPLLQQLGLDYTLMPPGPNIPHFAIIESLESLTHIFLKSYASDLPQILSPLSTLPRLSDLYLSVLGGWPTLSNDTIFLPNLEKLTFQGDSWDGIGSFFDILDTPFLQMLSLTGNQDIPQSDGIPLPSLFIHTFPNIDTLNLHHIYLRGDTLIDIGLYLPRLTRMHFSHCRITWDNFLASISSQNTSAQPYPALRHIILRRCTMASLLSLDASLYRLCTTSTMDCRTEPIELIIIDKMAILRILADISMLKQAGFTIMTEPISI